LINFNFFSLTFEGYINLNQKNIFESKKEDSAVFCVEYLDSFIRFNSENFTNKQVFINVTGKGEATFTYSTLKSDYVVPDLRVSALHSILNSTKLDLGLSYSENNRIEISRNHFGTIPLYFIHVPNQFFAFSTSLPLLVKHPAMSDYLELNPSRIVSYFNFHADAIRAYGEDTFYKNIKTVLPGHVLSVSAAEVTSKPYFNFDVKKWNHLTTKKEYSDQFRTFLSQSIKNCVFGSTVGSHLSGGLDSSSISSMTKFLFPETPLHTFYAETNTKLARESGYARSVSKEIGSFHHEVIPPENDFEVLSEYIPLYGHPECLISSPVLQGKLMEAALSEGCATLLTGYGGDGIAGTGLEYLQDLVEQKKWDLLEPLLKDRIDDPIHHLLFENWESFSPKKKYLYVKNYFFGKTLKRTYAKHGVLTTLALFGEINNQFGLSFMYFSQKAIKKLVSSFTSRRLVNNISTEPYSEQNNRPNNLKIRKLLKDPSDTRAFDRLESVYNYQSITASEEAFALSAYLGIELQIPMYDKDLFELSMATPAAFKYDDGYGRGHFRSAMQGIVPDVVLTRKDKGQYSLYGRMATLRTLEQSGDLLEKNKTVWKYIDKDKYNLMKAALQDDSEQLQVHNRAQFHVMRTISFAIWLNWLDTIKPRQN
jgi:asparagine synthase (glutamine-hydrolysing)